MKIIFIILVLFFNAQIAAAFTIATGSPNGTYFKIAQDIKGVAAKDGVDLNIISTNGSVENINLLGEGKADLAMVQKDVLSYFVDFVKEKGGADVFDRAKIVLNLYPEEIHVITTNKNIASFRDLENKRVGVGAKNSGSALTSAILFKAYKINPEGFTYKVSRAVEELKKGKLDAMIFVGGAPVSALKRLGKQFRFVRLPRNDYLGKIYQRKILERDFYSWAESDTATYAVHSVILAWSRNEKHHVQNLQRLVLSILSNKEKLESSGHPKWKKSLIRFFYKDVGFRPTNDIIEIFNALDSYGYKIIKR